MSSSGAAAVSGLARSYRAGRGVPASAAITLLFSQPACGGSTPPLHSLPLWDVARCLLGKYWKVNHSLLWYIFSLPSPASPETSWLVNLADYSLDDAAGCKDIKSRKIFLVSLLTWSLLIKLKKRIYWFVWDIHTTMLHLLCHLHFLLLLKLHFLVVGSQLSPKFITFWYRSLVCPFCHLPSQETPEAFFRFYFPVTETAAAALEK